MNRCITCRFFGLKTCTCDYFLLTGQRRGCAPEDCLRYVPHNSHTLRVSSDAAAALYTAFFMGMSDREAAEYAGVSLPVARRWRQSQGFAPGNDPSDGQCE